MKRFLIFAAIVLLAGCGAVRGTEVSTGTGERASSSSVPAAAGDAAESAETTAAPTVVEAETLDGERPGRVIPILSSSPPVELGDDDASASFDFRARELYSGSTIDGNDLFGQGQVLVTFVQPGCEISAEGGLTIAEVADLHPEAIYVIVHSGADDEAYIEFAEKAELFQENMVHLSDHFGSLAARYGVVDYPTTLLIDTDLRITSVTGVMDVDAQIEAVQAVTEQV